MKVKINNSFYRFFDDIKINQSLDTFASTFSFKARFNPNNPDHRIIFKPLSFPKIEILDDNNNLIFTGLSINTSLNSLSVEEMPSISGYSLPGILENSTIPFSSYPLEKNNVSLIDLVNDLCNPFGITSVFDSSVTSDSNLIYEKTVAEPSETVKSYISKLAAQRNIIVSHNEKGNLFFFKLNTSKSVSYSFNKKNTLSMKLDVNGQSMNSELTVIRQPSKTNTNLTPQDTTKNPLISTFKPFVKVLSSGEETATKNASINVLSSQLKNISLSLKINKIIPLKIGDIVDVVNDEIYLSNRTKFVVRSITTSINKSSDETVFNLVLPEVFNGGIPNNIFV